MPQMPKKQMNTLLQSLIAQPEVEPVSYEFQSGDGKWYPFIDQRNYDNTLADGRRPIRALYTHPPAPMQAITAEDVTNDMIISFVKATPSMGKLRVKGQIASAVNAYMESKK